MEEFENKNETMVNSDDGSVQPDALHQNSQDNINPSDTIDSNADFSKINQTNTIPNNTYQDTINQNSYPQNYGYQNSSYQGGNGQGNQNQSNPNQFNYNQGNAYQAGYGQNNPNYNQQPVHYPYGNTNNQTINQPQQNQNNRVPDYSFRAEQSPYARFNPATNTWEYSYHQAQYQTYQPKPPKKEKKPNKVLRWMGKAVCFGLIAGISFVGFQAIYYRINPSASQNNVYDKISGSLSSQDEQRYEIGYTKEGSIQFENKASVSKVVDATMPSIVSINSTSTQTSEWFGQQFSEEVQGSGSGFIVGKNEEELLVATNNHVVSGTNKIKVTFIDGSEAEAVIKGSDATADLAVVSVDITTLKKETLDTIKTATLGNSDDVKVGEMSIAIGNALGYGQSVTVGYVSAKDREVELSDGFDTKKMVLLQTDAAINPGNSGGALLNSDGEVIGINTVKYASNEVEGMGYAIPISRATPIINELMSREILTEAEQGYLGITGNDVSVDIAAVYNMPIGVFINDFAEESAAEKAGLMPGDIITSVNGIEITAITQLRDYVTSLRVGTKVEVTYMRNTDGEYKEGKATVTLGKYPNLKTGDE